MGCDCNLPNIAKRNPFVHFPLVLRRKIKWPGGTLKLSFCISAQETSSNLACVPALSFFLFSSSARSYPSFPAGEGVDENSQQMLIIRMMREVSWDFQAGFHRGLSRHWHIASFTTSEPANNTVRVLRYQSNKNEIFCFSSVADGSKLLKLFCSLAVQKNYSFFILMQSLFSSAILPKNADLLGARAA